MIAANTYDDANQVLSITYSKGPISLGNLTYSYDTAGRRVAVGGSLSEVSLPAALPAAAYDVNNRLTAWAGTALTYDANGNLTKDGTTPLTWNERDQLTGIGGSTVYGFKYDGAGRRQAKTVGGVTINFLYDGLNLVQELNGIAPLANYLTGLGIDETFQRTNATGVKSFLSDGLGSTLGLTDTLGNVTTQYKHEPYGKTTALGTADTNPIQYTGRENDGSGYYYYRDRYYNPKYQRFVSEDPIGLAGGPNLFAYINSSPTNGIDPLGDDWNTVKTIGQIAVELAKALGAPLYPNLPNPNDNLPAEEKQVQDNRKADSSTERPVNPKPRGGQGPLDPKKPLPQSPIPPNGPRPFAPWAAGLGALLYSPDCY